MKNILLLIGATLFLFACNSTADFVDKDGGFSIYFPSQPILTMDSLDTKLGTVVLYSFLAQSSLSSAKMLTYSDYPVNQQYIKDPYDFIDAAKEGALRSLGISNVIVDKRISLGGVPGLEVIGQNGQELLIHYKFFLKGNRLYQVGLVKEGEMEETEEELKYLQSFMLI